MNLRGLAGLLASLAFTAAAPADADKADSKPIPIDQPAVVSVTCEVVEVWATHGKGTVDPGISKQLAKRLGATLKQNDFKQQSSNKATLETKKAQTIKLSKGNASITLVETVNKSQARLTVDFTSAKGNSKQTTLVSAGDYLIVSVNQSNDPKAEAHVLAVGSCK
jgi:hypothetical protein